MYTTWYSNFKNIETWGRGCGEISSRGVHVNSQVSSANSQQAGLGGHGGADCEALASLARPR